MLSSTIAIFFLLSYLRMIEIGVNSFPEIFRIAGMAQEVCNILIHKQ